MKRGGKNEKFEEVFKRLFPEAYKKRQQQLRNKTKGKKHSEQRGMGPEEFFDRDRKAAQQENEDDWGEPIQVIRFSRGPSVIVRKVWQTDEGIKIKEYTENKDGSLNDQSGYLGGSNNPFGQMMGFVISPQQLMDEFARMNEDMEDPEMTDEEAFEQMFQMHGDEGNEFSFDDNVSTPYNTEHLEKMLEQALNEEDYETAAQLRDLLREDSERNNSDEE